MSLAERFRLPRAVGVYTDKYKKLWQVDDRGKIWELVEVSSPSSRLEISTQRHPFSRLMYLNEEERVLLAELVYIHLDRIAEDDSQAPFWNTLKDRLERGE